MRAKRDVLLDIYREGLPNREAERMFSKFEVFCLGYSAGLAVREREEKVGAALVESASSRQSEAGEA